MPALFLIATLGLSCWSARPRPARTRAHTLAAAAALLVLALSVAPSLVGWFTKPWPPPWFEGMGVETGAPTNDERPEGR